jgi:hypothetical protein
MGHRLTAAELGAATKFVMACGSDVDRARLAVLFGAASPDDRMIALAVRDQQGDGGFPATWSAGRSSLDATCHRLSQIADFGQAAADPTERAIEFLASRQRRDGTFEEDRSAGGAAPPQARPGDPAALLYITANCAYSILDGLQRQSDSGSARRLSVAVARAAAHLASRIGSDGRLPSFLHTHWLAGRVLRAAGFDDAADGLLWALAFRLSGLGPTALTWLIATVPEEPVAAGACDRLIQLQEPDGTWRSEDGRDHDVATTLSAIRVLRSA